MFQVALQRLVAPAPDPLLDPVLVPVLVDYLGDPHPEVEPQGGEAALEQHVAPQQLVIAAVQGAQDPRLGELILPHQPAGYLPGTFGYRRTGRLVTNERVP